jgi:hypothetical protein
MKTSTTSYRIFLKEFAHRRDRVSICVFILIVSLCNGRVTKDTKVELTFAKTERSQCRITLDLILLTNFPVVISSSSIVEEMVDL